MPSAYPVVLRNHYVAPVKNFGSLANCLYVMLYIKVRLRKTQLGDLAQSVKQVTAMSEIQGSNPTLDFF